jgi:hypothetical protein
LVSRPIATAPPAPPAGTVEVLVGLLAELDAATESGVFYDRVCRAVCSLPTMRRTALLLHDSTYRRVIPMGSHGVDPGLVKRIEGTLDETLIARRALEEDRVVEAHGDRAEQVPPRYADAACFLLSDLARATTGEILHVDGGVHAIGAAAPS